MDQTWVSHVQAKCPACCSFSLDPPVVILLTVCVCGWGVCHTKDCHVTHLVIVLVEDLLSCLHMFWLGVALWLWFTHTCRIFWGGFQVLANSCTSCQWCLRNLAAGFNEGSNSLLWFQHTYIHMNVTLGIRQQSCQDHDQHMWWPRGWTWDLVLERKVF